MDNFEKKEHEALLNRYNSLKKKCKISSIVIIVLSLIIFIDMVL